MATSFVGKPPFNEVKRDVRKSHVPVKFSSQGTPYVDTAVAAISPKQLEQLVQEQMNRRDKDKD